MKWSEAISLGSAVIGETHSSFYFEDPNGQCWGCAHGAGWVGAGINIGAERGIRHTWRYFPISRVRISQTELRRIIDRYDYTWEEAFGCYERETLGTIVNSLHCNGVPRLDLIPLIQEYEARYPELAEGVNLPGQESSQPLKMEKEIKECAR